MQLPNVVMVMVFIGILSGVYDDATAMPFTQSANSSGQHYDGSALRSETISVDLPECISDISCSGHGICRDGKCKCDKGWLTWRSSRPCSYEQRSKTIALIVSILLGSLGIDWFELSHGNGNYIFAGIMKLLVSSGCIVIPLVMSEKGRMLLVLCQPICALAGSIWWIVDWARILADSFPDGNSVPLASW